MSNFFRFLFFSLLYVTTYVHMFTYNMHISKEIFLHKPVVFFFRCFKWFPKRQPQTLVGEIVRVFFSLFHSQTSCQTTSLLLLIFAFFYSYSAYCFVSHIFHIQLPFIKIYYLLWFSQGVSWLLQLPFQLHIQKQQINKKKKR